MLATNKNQLLTLPLWHSKSNIKDVQTQESISKIEVRGAHPREVSIDQNLQLMYRVCIVSQWHRMRMSKCNCTIGLYKCMCMGLLIYRLIARSVQALLLKIWSEVVAFWIFLMLGWFTCSWGRVLLSDDDTCMGVLEKKEGTRRRFEGVSCLQQRSYSSCCATAHLRSP